MPSWVDGAVVDQRVVEAAAALQEDYGGVTGWAGLGWLSPRWFDGTPWGGGPTRPVTLAVGGNRWTRQQKYFETSEERLAPGDLIVVDGLRITTPVRSVLFEMRYARNARDGAISLSMACYDDLVSIDEVAAYAATLNGWTGIPQAREALALACENAWSPREVAMSHVWMLDAELPQVRYNCPVFDLGGRHIGTPDLLDPVAGVYGQYDSALHLTGARRAIDLDRDERFLRHGLEGAIMLPGDVVDPTAFVRRLRAAYDRAAGRSSAGRHWTVEQPPWWIDTTTVAARRALDSTLRARLLAHRAA
ncbi:hypothetical protein [Nocardioides aquiterrae]|uniref:hypothetical protein n=1 Tax=Nocardioides aquiterrae TaxID=203799 RepID=UPI0031DB7F69